MNKTISALLLSTVLSIGCGGDRSSTTDLDWALYKQAVSVADLVTAASALNSVISKDSTQTNAYDSLALIYLNLGMDRSAAITANKGLKKNETATLLEVSAASLKNLGDGPSSLQNYLRLLELKPDDIGFMYEAAFGYIQLQQHQNAIQYVDLMIGHPDAETKMITEFINQQGQQLPYKAVALNMRGFIQMSAGDDSGAIQSYQQALALAPDYQLALNNLKVLSAKQESAE